MPVVPIGKRYGGTETFASPFGGMGLLKTENGQIIREYKIPNGQSVDIEEAAMYMIDKNGTHRKVAIFNGKQWKKDKELYDANTSKI